MLAFLPDCATLCLQFAWGVRHWNEWSALPLERSLQKAIDLHEGALIPNLLFGVSPFASAGSLMARMQTEREKEDRLLEGVELNLRPLVQCANFRHVVNFLLRYGWKTSELEPTCTAVEILTHGRLQDVQSLMHSWPFFLCDHLQVETETELEEILYLSVKNKHTHILQWVHDHYAGLLSMWPPSVLTSAVRHGDVDILDFLVRLKPGFPDINVCYDYLFDSKNLVISCQTISVLIREGCLGMLQHIRRLQPQRRWSAYHLHNAFYLGKLDIVQWFRKFMSPVSTLQWKILLEGTQSLIGVFPLLQEAVERHLDKDTIDHMLPSLLRTAIRQGSLQVVRWILRLLPVTQHVEFLLEDVLESGSVEMTEWFLRLINLPVQLTSSVELLARCLDMDEVPILKLMLEKYGREFFVPTSDANPLQMALQQNVGFSSVEFLIDLGFTKVISVATDVSDTRILQLLYSRTPFRFGFPNDFQKALEDLSWSVLEFMKPHHPEVGQWSATWQYGLEKHSVNVDGERTFYFESWQTLSEMFPGVLSNAASWEIASNADRQWYLQFLVEQFPIPAPVQSLVIDSVFRTNNLYLIRFLVERHSEISMVTMATTLQAIRRELVEKTNRNKCLIDNN